MGLAVLIDRPGYRLAADCKVIKRSDALVVGELTQAYALAQQQIDTAFRNTEAACEGIAAEAYQKGLDEAKREAARRLTVAELDRKALLDSLRPVLAELVFDAVALISKSLDRRATIARALELLQGSMREVSWARLHVHPDAVDTTQHALDEMLRESDVGRVARVVPDDSVPRDGCIFESELGRIDASLDTQLHAIREAIAGAARSVVHDPGPNL